MFFENNYNFNNNGIKKEKKSSKLKNLIVILISLLLIFIIFIVVLKYVNTPFKVYKNVINYSYDLLSDSIDDLESSGLKYDIKNDSLNYVGDFNIKTNLSGLDEINSYDFSYDLGVDVKNEKQ